MHFFAQNETFDRVRASADRAIILMVLLDRVLRSILEFFHDRAISRKDRGGEICA
jgi:hypothetical protein